MIEAILILSLIITVAFFARFNEGSWLSPGAFFAMLWSLYILCALFFIEDFDTLGTALLWILLSCWTIHFGCLFGKSLTTRTERASNNIHATNLGDFPYLKKILLIFTMMGLIEICYISYTTGFSMTTFLSLESISGVSAGHRAEFYFGELNQGVIERILFIFVYAAPLFGGLLYKLTPSKWVKIFTAISLFVVVFVGTLYGSRMGVLFGGSFWISAHMATHLLTRTTKRIRDRGYMFKILAISVLVITGLSLLVMIIRYEETSIITADILLYNLSDQFAFLPAFAQWFQSEGMRFSDLTLGHRTFGRTYELLGMHFADKYFYSPTDLGFTTSNVHTVFRDLIEDFSPVGALVCLFLLGMVGGVSYRRVLRGERNFLPVLTTIYVFTFTSFSFSLFVYTGPTLALVIFLVYFLCFRRGLRENRNEMLKLSVR